MALRVHGSFTMASPARSGWTQKELSDPMHLVCGPRREELNFFRVQRKTMAKLALLSVPSGPSRPRSDRSCKEVIAHLGKLPSRLARLTTSLRKLRIYSPFQRAFGRQPTLTGRFRENGNDDPWWTSVKESRELISRASNAKTRRKTTFLPGDLVYFKRMKPPAQPQSHLRLAHKLWSSIIWSHGRLKRCSPEQLRHASERERLKECRLPQLHGPSMAWPPPCTRVNMRS